MTEFIYYASPAASLVLFLLLLVAVWWGRGWRQHARRKDATITLLIERTTAQAKQLDDLAAGAYPCPRCQWTEMFARAGE